jgi:hypothetical protein
MIREYDSVRKQKGINTSYLHSTVHLQLKKFGAKSCYGNLRNLLRVQFASFVPPLTKTLSDYNKQ